jgi:hypothetical protein
VSRPRIRTIKPETWHDEKIGTLSRDARLLFVGLITMADDDGRLRGMPAAILGHVFPYDDDAPQQLEAWLADLERAALIVRYRVAGLPYRHTLAVSGAEGSHVAAVTGLDEVISASVRAHPRSGRHATRKSLPTRRHPEVGRHRQVVGHASRGLARRAVSAQLVYAWPIDGRRVRAMPVAGGRYSGHRYRDRAHSQESNQQDDGALRDDAQLTGLVLALPGHHHTDAGRWTTRLTSSAATCVQRGSPSAGHRKNSHVAAAWRPSKHPS